MVHEIVRYTALLKAAGRQINLDRPNKSAGVPHSIGLCAAVHRLGDAALCRHPISRVPCDRGATAAELRDVCGLGLQWIGQRRPGSRSHRRKAVPQVERPHSRRPRSAVPDPKPTSTVPISLPLSCRSDSNLGTRWRPAAEGTHRRVALTAIDA